MDQFERDGLVFDVADSGPPDGEVVVLLHGFPETNASWRRLTPALTQAGYRVLAPNQRGYSPRARPRGRWAYRGRELVADVVALADAAGGPDTRIHVVGHDWGGAVAWMVAMAEPLRVRTLTVLSTPHPRAFLRSWVTSSQLAKSWYMFFFQLPVVPERLAGGRRFRRALVDSGLSDAQVATYFEVLDSPSAMRAAINWYRAMFFTPIPRYTAVSVPTLYVYSTGDMALGRKGADLTARWVTGPYRYEVLEGVSHWIPEEAADEVGPMLLDHLGKGAA